MLSRWFSNLVVLVSESIVFLARLRVMKLVSLLGFLIIVPVSTFVAWDFGAIYGSMVFLASLDTSLSFCV
jgi:uncharacterized membrane protein